MISMTVARNESYYFALQNEHALEYYKTESEGYFLSTPEGSGLSHEDKVTAETLKDFAGVKRYAVDITVSAPKSISVAWGLGDEKVRQDMLEAHRYAVEQVAKEIQNYIYTRDRSKAALESGQIYQKAEGVMVGFDHFVSRAQDPQLHTHILVMNQVKNEKGEWKAIESKFLFEQQRYLDSVYKQALAEKLLEKGYELRGTENGFELAKISDSLIQEFSTRSQQIEEKLSELGLTRETASAGMKEIIALDTREKKEYRTLPELRSEWQERAGLKEISYDSLKQEEKVKQEERASELINKAIDALSYNYSALEKEKVISNVIEILHRYGVFVDRNFIEKEVDIERGEINRNGVNKEVYVIKSVEKLEKEVVSNVEGLRNTKEAFMTFEEALRFIQEKEEKAGIRFTEDQKNAIVTTLTSRDGFVIWQGVAGAGKTFTLSQVAEVLRGKEFKLVALAPTGKAAEVLASEMRSTGIEAEGKTIDRFRIELERYKELERLYEATRDIRKAAENEKIYFTQSQNVLANGKGEIIHQVRIGNFVIENKFYKDLHLQYERGEIKSFVIDKAQGEIRYIVVDKDTQAKHESIENKFNSIKTWHTAPNFAQKLPEGVKDVLKVFGVDVRKTETIASQVYSIANKVLGKSIDVKAKAKTKAYVLEDGSKMLVEKDKAMINVYIKNRQGEITSISYKNNQLLSCETFITKAELERQVETMKEEFAKTVFVVDESSMSSVRNMHELTKLMTDLKDTDARMIAIGDIHQLKAVSEGDIFRNIQQETKTAKTELTTIFRQKDATYRAIATALAGKDFQKAIELMEREEKVKVDTFERIKEEIKEKFQPGDTLIVTKTNKDAQELNQAVREALKEKGYVDKKEIQVTVRVAKSLEAIDMLKASSFEKGDVLVFQKGALKELGIKGRGNEFKVFEVKDNVIVLQRTDVLQRASLYEVKASDLPLNKFSVYQEKQIGLSKGDIVMTLKNDSHLGVKNGEMWKIERIEGTTLHLRNDAKQVQIDLKDYNYINYGYAVTTHKSQGMTTKQVFYVNQSSKAEYSNVYVGLTRGKEDFKVYLVRDGDRRSKSRFYESMKQEAVKFTSFDVTKSQSLSQGSQGSLSSQSSQSQSQSLSQSLSLSQGSQSQSQSKESSTSQEVSKEVSVSRVR
ncbi:MAG: MobF family relaxase [Candidatus Aenigmatarchaeota archaeon]